MVSSTLVASPDAGRLALHQPDLARLMAAATAMKARPAISFFAAGISLWIDHLLPGLETLLLGNPPGQRSQMTAVAHREL